MSFFILIRTFQIEKRLTKIEIELAKYEDQLAEILSMNDERWRLLLEQFNELELHEPGVEQTIESYKLGIQRVVQKQLDILQRQLPGGIQSKQSLLP